MVDPFNPENPDFHLQPASPAIDNGADVNFSYDLEGNVRPFGGGFDIGPYEFQGIKENTAPIIVIVSPSEGDGYKIGSDVDIEVNAKDDGKVVKVEYYLNDSYIGEAESEPFNFTLSNIPEGINTLYAIAYDDVGLSNKSAEVIFIVSDSDSMVVGSSFKNLTIPDQKGIATVTFDAIPMADNMNGVIGVTFGQASAFSDLAAIVRFNPDGLIDAFKGGATPPYTYENQIPYSAWKIYKFTMTIDISNRIFSATVRDEEGNTHVIAENYPFRPTGAVGADKLDTIAGLSEVSSYILLFNPDDNIPVEAESVDIKEESIKIKVGSTRKLNATVYPENAYNKVLEWTSSDESIATVDKNGTVTAVAEGQAIITARVAGTEITDTCTVEVTLEEEATIIITGPDTVVKGETFTIDIGFDCMDEIFNADLTISYDADLAEYEGYTEIEGGLSVFEADNDVPGTLRFLFAAEASGAINEEIPLIQLTFKAKDITGNCDISIAEAILVAEGDLINGVKIYPALDSITVEVTEKPAVPGDLNKDGVVDIMDLYVISKNYLKDSSDPDWEIIKVADTNNDGIIDITDLVFVAQKILEVK